MLKFASPALLLVIGLHLFHSADAACAKGPQVGDATPRVALTGTDGRQHRTDDLGDAKALVVVFTCSKCPVSTSYTKRLNSLAKRFREKRVRLLAINSSDQAAESQRHAKRFNFAYAHDPAGQAANAFGARMTPVVFVINSKRRIAYRGAFDNSQRRPTRHYVRDAVESVLANRPVKTAQTDPFGCSLRLLAAKPALQSGE